jgi:hypothetical protein
MNARTHAFQIVARILAVVLSVAVSSVALITFCYRRRLIEYLANRPPKPLKHVWIYVPPGAAAVFTVPFLVCQYLEINSPLAAQVFLAVINVIGFLVLMAVAFLFIVQKQHT